MGAYVLRRILIAIPILIGITIISFMLLASAPGDPVRALISPEQLANMTDAICSAALLGIIREGAATATRRS